MTDPCPIAEFCDALRAGRPPLLAWAMRWETDPGVDPLRAAWSAATDPNAMVGLLHETCGRAISGMASGVVRHALDEAGMTYNQFRRRGYWEVMSAPWDLNVERDPPVDTEVARIACEALRTLWHEFPLTLESAFESWGLPDVP